MNKNLDDLLSHIIGNFRFGSKIKQHTIDRWFKEYTLTIEDKLAVYDELDSLEIKITDSPKAVLKAKLLRLFKCLEGEEEVERSVLTKWFYQNNIDENIQEDIVSDLDRRKLFIINDLPQQNENSDIDIPDDLLEDDLDSLLEDEDFIEQVDSLEDVIDKSRNLEYLAQLHSEDTSKRNKSLSYLVEANTKLVWKLVKRYSGQATIGFNEEDMYQVGMIGLINAAEKFDASLGNQFSTYAVWWIGQAITRGIADYANLIRIPVHQFEKMNKLIKIENELWNELERPATTDELAEEMGEPIDVIEELHLYISRSNLASLDRPVGDEEDTRLGDLIEDEDLLQPEQEYFKQERRTMITEVAKTNLTNREAEILYHRFGFRNDEGMTLESVGKIFKVTRERIRQIERNALNKLRRPKTAKILKEYLHEN